MNIPKPNGSRCVYCGKPVQDWEVFEASKGKHSRHWNYAHTDCAYPKTKEADTGVRFK